MDDVKPVSDYEKAVINDDRYVESLEADGETVPQDEVGEEIGWS